MGSQIIEQKEKFSWKKISNWGRQHIWEIASILVAIIGLILFMMHRNYDVSKPIDGSLWGQFGDYVGGIVGSIIAYISVKLLSENLREQKTANEYLKDSNDNAKKVMELEQFDRTFSTLLNMYGTSQDELTKIDNEIESFLSFKCSKKEYNEAVKEAVIQYEVFYCNNRQVLAPYLRVLFQLLQMIADSSMNKDIQIKYAKILRAQLTDKELLILRYNAMTSYGKKMQFYLNYFKMNN